MTRRQFVSVIHLTMSVVLACVTLSAIAQSPDPAFEQLKSYLFGRDATTLDKITAMVQASRGNPTQRAVVAAGLASVLTSSASFDAKQFACRQLVFVAGEPEVPAMASLLSDDKLCHYALMALAKIPGKAVNDAVFAHVYQMSEGNRLEMLSLLAARSDRRAIEGLANLLDDRDSPLRAAAALALTQTGDTGEIEDIMVGRGISPTGGWDSTIYAGMLKCAYRYLDEGDKKRAAIIFKINDDSPQATVRAAALRGLVLASSDPVSLIIKALAEDGKPRQKMAAEIVNEVSGSPATRAFAAALPKLTPRGQMLLLTALGNRGDEAGSAGIMALSRSLDTAIRLAAFKALGQVGNVTAVSLLLNAAATGIGEERDAARLSLARLNDDRVDKALAGIAISSTESSARRIEAITAIGARGAKDAAPEIMHAAADKNGKVSGAAFAVLRDIAPPSQLAAVVSLVLSLPADNRDAAVEAAAEIARRGTAEAQRTGPVLSALQSAKKPEDRLTLLTILNQIGGAAALQQLEKAVSDPIPAVSGGALSLVAEWPSDEPMSLLLRTVRAPGEPRRKTIALRGYLRMIGANDQRSPEATLELYRDVAAVANRPDDKRQVLSGVAKLQTLAALQFAAGLLKDADVKAEAETALVSIGRSTVGAYPNETRAALEPIAASGTDEAVQKQAADVLALPSKAGDYIIAWEVSPAYHQDGVDYTRLFDMPFPPEIAAKEQETPWRLMPIVTNPEQPWLLDLLALWGGEQKVAYLRTAVISDAPRDLILELGSDDGVKGWLNGSIIVSVNTQGGVTPGQEKVKVHLNAGRNTLLLKITQNVLGWGACARFTSPDGSSVTGLKNSVVSK